jgi:hypothetical protein
VVDLEVEVVEAEVDLEVEEVVDLEVEVVEEEAVEVEEVVELV